jgi:hypothetical protein
MANIVVTQYNRVQQISTNRDLIVTADLTGFAFHVYCYIPQRNLDFKVRAGLVTEFTILRNETVECEAMGSGTIVVNTRNAP